MIYVVVLLKMDDGADEPKVFTNSAGAIRLYEAAQRAIGEPIRMPPKGDEERILLACEMFKVDAPNVREAARLAKEGKAKPFSKPLSERQERNLQPLLDMLKDDD
jgi:hypothetical protein